MRMKGYTILLAASMLAAQDARQRPQPSTMQYAQPVELHIRTFAERSLLVGPNQTPDQVRSIMGPPEDVKGRRKGDDSNATWYYASPSTEPFATLGVTFSRGKVKRIRLMDEEAQAAAAARPSKADKVLQIGATLYLAWACPQIRRKPIVLLTTDDVELLQACKSAGF